MKKMISLLGVMALMLAAFGVFAVGTFADGHAMACPEGEADIVMTSGAVGAEYQANQEVIARFMEMCPNITVSLLETPDSATDRLALYQQFWEAESPDVDVFQVDVIWPGIVAPHAVDMNEYMSAEEIAQYFPDMIGGQTVDGALVALPWFTDAAGLYYRTDLLEKYGVEVPTTWEELEAAAQTIQDGERAEGNADFYGYVWQGNSYEGLTCDAHEWLVSETGTSFITPEGEINVNNPEFVAALERAVGWVGGISPEGVTTYQEEESRGVWQAGNAAFMRNWPYAFNLGNGEDSAVAGNFGYAPLPSGAVRGAACLGGWQLMASRYSDSPAAAAALVKFITSPDEQFTRALGPTGNNPTIPALYETDEFAADALFSAMGPILSTAYPRPSVITAERYNEASTIFFSGVHDVLTGQTDAQTAVEDMEIDLQDLVGEIMGM
jgi:trehalose/maltose transport system substrate-binding protein